MGLISFYGTDSGDNPHEKLAYMDAIITDSAHGSEAASLRFYVAENNATLTAGLVIAGQADDDGEINVTIGAGTGSTSTVAGNLTVGAGIVMEGSNVVMGGSGTSPTVKTANDANNLNIRNANDNKYLNIDYAATGGSLRFRTMVTDESSSTVRVAYDASGNAVLSAKLTVGATGGSAGYDVQFFGETSGAYMLWDESADDLKLVGAAGLTVAGDIDVAGTTNLDVVDIDGAVDIAGVVTFNAATKPAAPAAASGTSGIVVLDCSTTNHFTITASGNITGWNFTNASTGQRIIVRVTNGGSHTVAFSATGDGDVVYFPGGTEPTLTTGSGAIDVYGFLCVASDTFDGFIIGQDIKA